MSKKQEIINEIEKKEQILHKAELESNAWNSGKYKNSSNAKVTTVFVESLKKDIERLNTELSALE